MTKIRILVFYMRCSCLLLAAVLHLTNAQYYSGMQSMPGMPSIPGMQNSGAMSGMPDFSGYPGFSSGPPPQSGPPPPPQVIHEAPPQIITQAAPPQIGSGLNAGLTRFRNRYSIGGINPNSLRQLILPAIAMGAAFHFGRTH